MAMFQYQKIRRISSNLFEDANNRYIVSLDNHMELMAGITSSAGSGASDAAR